jgi:hypothetical protein
MSPQVSMIAGSGNQHGDSLFDEPALGEVGDQLLIDARIEVEVEALVLLVSPLGVNLLYSDKAMKLHEVVILCQIFNS